MKFGILGPILGSFNLWKLSIRSAGERGRRAKGICRESKSPNIETPTP